MLFSGTIFTSKAKMGDKIVFVQASNECIIYVSRTYHECITDVSCI